MSGSQLQEQKRFRDAPDHVVPVCPRQGAREEVIGADDLCSAGGAWLVVVVVGDAGELGREGWLACLLFW